MSEAGAVAEIVDALAAEEGPLTAKKQRLVEAAILCFAENGYAATSTRLIAARACVAEATIFRHFATKKALLLRISGPVIARLLKPAVKLEIDDLLQQSNGDVRSFMRAIMLSRLEFADQYAPFVRILLQEILVDPDLRALVKTNASLLFNDVFLKALQHFQTAGQLPKIPPERLLRMIMSLLAGYYLHRVIFAPGDWNDQAEVDAIIDLVLGVGDKPKVPF